MLNLVPQIKDRRFLAPAEPAACLRVTILEQRIHVGTVEFFMLYVRKVGLDIGQV